MNLQVDIEPERVRKWGEQIVEIAPPGNIKIHTTGAGAQTLLDEGPPNGKKWRVLIRVEAAESNE